MLLVINLPEELATRIVKLAETRHLSAERLAIEAIETGLGAPRRLGLSGVGASGSSDTARRQRRVIAEAMGSKTARDI